MDSLVPDRRLGELHPSEGSIAIGAGNRRLDRRRHRRPLHRRRL